MSKSAGIFKTLLISPTWWIGVAISLALFLFASEAMHRKAQGELEYEASLAHTALQTQLNSYINILRSTQALFYSQNEVTRGEFHTFAEQLDFVQNYPALRSLNYAAFIGAQQKSDFEAAVRADRSSAHAPFPPFLSSLPATGLTITFSLIWPRSKRTRKPMVWISLPQRDTLMPLHLCAIQES